MKNIKMQLGVLKAFQAKYPKSHVGGSIGLHLQGIDLKRNLWFSDLDITTPEFTPTAKSAEHGCSPVEDYDHRYQIDDPHSEKFIKLEIRIDKDQSYDEVLYEGVTYNVTKVETILKWKQEYALKGHEKHLHDLLGIATGIRPKDKN